MEKIPFSPAYERRYLQLIADHIAFLDNFANSPELCHAYAKINERISKLQ